MNTIDKMQVELEALTKAMLSLNLIQTHVLETIISELTDEQLDELKEYCFTQCDGTEMYVVKVDRQAKAFVCVPSFEITKYMDSAEDVNPELHVNLGYNVEDIDTLQAKELVEYIMFHIVKYK